MKNEEYKELIDDLITDFENIIEDDPDKDLLCDEMKKIYIEL